MQTERVNKLISSLERNNFEVFHVADKNAARICFEEKILKDIKYTSVSYADSITVNETGVLNSLRENTNVEFVDTFNKDDSWAVQIKNRKRALTVDLFITGTNAITERGQLVNLDMIGNRVAALAFGPRTIVLFIGINKIVKNLDEAFLRVRTVAAPANAKLHEDLSTPCKTSGVCHDCRSPHRICNTWSIIEKSYPKKRIKIVLIDEKLGL